jgi:hypothetical protein
MITMTPILEHDLEKSWKSTTRPQLTSADNEVERTAEFNEYNRTRLFIAPSIRFVYLKIAAVLPIDRNTVLSQAFYLGKRLSYSPWAGTVYSCAGFLNW